MLSSDRRRNRREAAPGSRDMTNWQAQTIVSDIEAQGGAPVFTVRAEGSSSKWQPDAASWKPMGLALVRGTIVGAAGPRASQHICLNDA